MIQRTDVIQNALRKLGNVTHYNDTSDRMYITAEDTIEWIVRQMCFNNKFEATATTIELTSSTQFPYTGEYIFNLPNDFAGVKTHPRKVKPLSHYPRSVYDDYEDYSHSTYRVEGKFIYSNSPKVIFSYSRIAPIEDLPEYMEPLLTVMLAEELSRMYPVFADKLLDMQREVQKETQNIQYLEGMPNRMEVKNG